MHYCSSRICIIPSPKELQKSRGTKVSWTGSRQWNERINALRSEPMLGATLSNITSSHPSLQYKWKHWICQLALELLMKIKWWFWFPPPFWNKLHLLLGLISQEGDQLIKRKIKSGWKQSSFHPPSRPSLLPQNANLPPVSDPLSFFFPKSILSLNANPQRPDCPYIRPWLDKLSDKQSVFSPWGARIWDFPYWPLFEVQVSSLRSL